MSWRIYYDNDQTFSDDDGPWDEAPNEGVLVIVETLNGQTAIHSGHDFYQLEDDGSIVMRDERTILHAVGYVVMSTVKFGRYTSNRRMARTLERAVQEAKG